jgi:hypothetical protein
MHLRRTRAVFSALENVGQGWTFFGPSSVCTHLYNAISWRRRALHETNGRPINIRGRKAQLGSVRAACLGAGGYGVGRWLKRPQSKGGAGDGCDAGRPGFRAQFEPTMYYAPDGESRARTPGRERANQTLRTWSGLKLCRFSLMITVGAS